MKEHGHDDKHGELIARIERYGLCAAFGLLTGDEEKALTPIVVSALSHEAPSELAACRENLAYWKQLAESLGGVSAAAQLHVAPPEASSMCPMCGVDTPHPHGERQVVDWLRIQAARFYPEAKIQIAGTDEAGIPMARLLTDKFHRCFLLPVAPKPYKTLDSDGHPRTIESDWDRQRITANGHLDRDSLTEVLLYASPSAPSSIGAPGTVDIQGLLKNLDAYAETTDPEASIAEVSARAIRQLLAASATLTPDPRVAVLIRVLDDLEESGNGWNPATMPNNANEAERKFRDMLVTNWKAIRALIPIRRADGRADAKERP